MKYFLVGLLCLLVATGAAAQVPSPDQTFGVVRLNRPAVGNTSMLQFGLSDVLLENVTEFNGSGLLIRNWFNNAYLTSLKLNANGKVGIGTAAPRAMLDISRYVSGGALASVLARQSEGDGVGDGTFIGVKGFDTQWASGGKSFSIEHGFYGEINSSINFFRGVGEYGGFLAFNTQHNSERMRITPEGRVGIGTTAPDAMLSVKGTIHAQEVKVDLNVPGPDYVFDDNYPLIPLRNVAEYIAINKHLPDVPDAATMKEQGLDLGETNMLLLRKIEELTLYLIEVNKKVDELVAENEKLKAEHK